MRTCIFCNTEYLPRAQVKNPKACSNPDCQKKRQGLNEKEWRERNKPLNNKKYHQVRRLQRLHKLSNLAAYIARCLKTGMDMINLGQALPSLHKLTSWIHPFLQEMGIRSANKFWNLEISSFYNELERYLYMHNVQTSSSTN